MTLPADSAATVDAYFSMWNESDPARRRALIERTWLSDAESLDPTTRVTGWDAIEGFVASLQRAYPDHLVALDGAVDAHHEWVRFRWRITAPTGADFLSGLDCVQLAAATDDRVSPAHRSCAGRQAEEFSHGEHREHRERRIELV